MTGVGFSGAALADAAGAGPLKTEAVSRGSCVSGARKRSIKACSATLCSRPPACCVILDFLNRLPWPRANLLFEEEVLEWLAQMRQTAKPFLHANHASFLPDKGWE